MDILIAPNAFKNSLSASDAASAIRRGFIESGLPCRIRCFPIGDGGDGTASLIVKNKNGFFREVFAQDPAGRKIQTQIGYINEGKTAVIEMADISGLRQLQSHELDPLHVTSYGTGELIRQALNTGVRKIILGIGGSATVDGGSGALEALGFLFLDQSKKQLTGLPENLIHLASVDCSGADRRMRDTELILLCDVDNRLLGENGAAAVFGPQKGASEDDLVRLENALLKLKDVCLQQTGKDMNTARHGGAAGGIAAGLNIFLNAELVQGIEYFLDLTGFDDALQKTDLVITGEGRIDAQTLEGKGPFGVARRAKKKNIPVIGMAGQISIKKEDPLMIFFDELIPVNNPCEDLNTSLQHTAVNLQKAAAEIGKNIAKRLV